MSRIGLVLITVVSFVLLGFLVGHWVRLGDPPFVPSPTSFEAPSQSDHAKPPPAARSPGAVTGPALRMASASGAQQTNEAPPAERAEPAAKDAWSHVPLDRTSGEALGSIGSFSTRKAFSEGIATYSRPGFAACFQDYEPPRGIEKYSLTIELRIVAREAEFYVEDAVALEANYGDERLERCIIQLHRGRSIKVPPEVSGRHRLEWKSIKYFKRAPG